METVNHKKFFLKTTGDSMLPIIHDNDFLFNIKKSKYFLDDVVSFKSNLKSITHRITYINNSIFYSKGDNNLKNEGPLSISLILGKVEYVIRNKTKIPLSLIYRTIFDKYVFELSKINNELNQKKINFVYIKGPINHLYYKKEIPNYFYCDCDILINKKNFIFLKKILLKNKFKFKKTLNNANQFSFFKYNNKIAISLDIHIKPGIFFTSYGYFNKYFASKKYLNTLTNIFLKNRIFFNYSNSSFPLLNTESQLLYLYIHFYHHNFLGIEKIRLTQFIVKITNLNKFVTLVKKTNTQKIIRKSIEIEYTLKKNKKIRRMYKLLFKKEIPSSINVNYLSVSKLKNRILRFYYVFKFSNASFLKKIQIFFDPFFYKIFFNLFFKLLRLPLDQLAFLKKYLNHY